jgi:hypothetical protein
VIDLADVATSNGLHYSRVTQDFEVQGNHEFIVEMVMLSNGYLGTGVEPNTDPAHANFGGDGDPSLSLAVPVEQYRDKYIFLAPTDYDHNYVDIVTPLGAQLMLDGAAVTQSATPVTPSLGVIRLPLGAATGGVHVLTGDQRFGIQVIGYGQYTSYQYPGGLNFKHIAPPPPPIT